MDDDDEHPKFFLDVAEEPLDLETMSAEQLAEALRRVHRKASNYLGVYLGASAASLCMSRALYRFPLSHGKGIEYLGISVIASQSGHRRKGHMRRLVRVIKEAATLLERTVIITEAYSTSLRSILDKHPQCWRHVGGERMDYVLVGST
jgi:hypothetical protein